MFMVLLWTLLISIQVVEDLQQNKEFTVSFYVLLVQ